MKSSYDFSTGTRGPVVPPAPGKTTITLRLDDEVIDWFRQQVNAAGGGNYESLIDAALREHIQCQGQNRLEETLRKVIREELRGAG
ncbi:MAG: BrnA antitoxin family protein [Chromatiaceae bacterium]|jgi:hypothetical protein|nr:BrnA antitoxin family protein [Chromatiaceae bacterium]